MTPHVDAFFDTATNTVTYLVSDPATGHAAVIDPVLDLDPASGRVWTASADAVIAAAEAKGLHIQWVLETHAHADHLSGAQRVKDRTGAPVVIGDRIGEVQGRFSPLFMAHDVAPDGRAFDRLIGEDDILPLGELSIRAIHTPGHTPACVTYLIADAAFVGDTLFMPDYGTARADFPGGDAATLYRSIRRILSLPADTRIFVGHDYTSPTRTDFAWETTVARERAENVHVRDGVSEDAFVAMREARDRSLGAPRLLLPSLQVNIRAGHLPPREADGGVRLKLPLTLTPAAESLVA